MSRKLTPRKPRRSSDESYGGEAFEVDTYTIFDDLNCQQMKEIRAYLKELEDGFKRMESEEKKANLKIYKLGKEMSKINNSYNDKAVQKMKPKQFNAFLMKQNKKLRKLREEADKHVETLTIIKRERPVMVNYSREYNSILQQCILKKKLIQQKLKQIKPRKA